MSDLTIPVQHALALFRTQKIQTLKLQLDVDNAEQLIAIVLSDNGEHLIISAACNCLFCVWLSDRH